MQEPVFVAVVQGTRGERERGGDGESEREDDDREGMRHASPFGIDLEPPVGAGYRPDPG